MENAKKFFEEIIKTEEAKALLAAVEAPKTEEDRIAAYIEIAKRLGVELTTEDIQEYFATASDADVAELDDEELEQLVGGGAHDECKYSYKNEENCILFDGCDGSYRSYDAYICKSNNAGGLKYEGPLWEAVYTKNYTICQYPSVLSKFRELMGREP
jgi:hypothetical protein